jgi:hypothetical protein
MSLVIVIVGVPAVTLTATAIIAFGEYSPDPVEFVRLDQVFELVSETAVIRAA